MAAQVYAGPHDAAVTQITDGRPSSSLSAPAVVADMLDSLLLEPGQRVLELGAGTGWNAALLADRVGPGRVISVEVDDALAAAARARLDRAGVKADVEVGDGAAGWPVEAPYDRLIATYAVEEVPWAWVEQTAPGGRIVTPWGRLGRHPPPYPRHLTIHTWSTVHVRIADGTSLARTRGGTEKMATDDLLATCWTTAGDVLSSADGSSPLSLRERAEAAGAAGFTGFGLSHVDLVEAERVYGLTGIRSILDDNGLSRFELEPLTDWWTDGPRRTASDAVRRDLLRAAEELGAHHIKIAPDIEAGPWELDVWAEEFATLAAQADEAGTLIGIEPLTWSNIRTVHDALRLVEAAGHPAGGLVVDVWQTERAHTPPADLADIPLPRIVAVELSDADDVVIGNLLEDTFLRRRLCGEGSFDLPGFISALRKAGWSGPWGVEILSNAHRALPVREAADAAYRTAAALLAA